MLLQHGLYYASKAVYIEGDAKSVIEATMMDKWHLVSSRAKEILEKVILDFSKFAML